MGGFALQARDAHCSGGDHRAAARAPRAWVAGRGLQDLGPVCGYQRAAGVAGEWLSLVRASWGSS